jgi:hypothetical protein
MTRIPRLNGAIGAQNPAVPPHRRGTASSPLPARRRGHRNRAAAMRGSPTSGSADIGIV